MIRRRPRGRPRLDSSARRDRVVEVRLSDAEREALAKRAAKAALPLSTYLRAAGLRARIAAPPPLENIQMYRSLVKLGHLLNQALKAVHAGKVNNVNPRLLTELAKTVRQLAIAALGVKP